MAKAFIVWDGMTEYREELRQLPAACVGEAAHIVEGGVNDAYQTVSAVYGAHHVTGELQRKLTMSPLKVGGQFSTGLVLKSGSRLAWLFDNGSQARHYVTKHGRMHATGAMWGRTPPTHIFASTVARTKRAIVDQLKAMVLRRGATSVTET